MVARMVALMAKMDRQAAVRSAAEASVTADQPAAASAEEAATATVADMAVV